MTKLAEALSGEGPGSEWGSVPFVRIDGSTDSYDRRLAVNRFRDDPNVRVALLSVTAAGAWLITTFGQSCIYMIDCPIEMLFLCFFK